MQEVTQKVNGGLNGYLDRLQRFNAVAPLLGGEKEWFMRSFIFGLSLLISSFYTLAKSDIVQGPFKLDNDASVYIKKENDVNYPLALYFEANGNGFKVGSYEVDGSESRVETVFLLK